MLKVIGSVLMAIFYLIKISEGPNGIHHSTKSETAIQWCSSKDSGTIKSHPKVNVHINYRLLLWKDRATFQYH